MECVYNITKSRYGECFSGYGFERLFEELEDVRADDGLLGDALQRDPGEQRRLLRVELASRGAAAGCGGVRAGGARAGNAQSGGAQPRGAILRQRLGFVVHLQAFVYVLLVTYDVHKSLVT